MNNFITNTFQIKREIINFLMERVARIELARPGRKHGILPLNYTRIGGDEESRTPVRKPLTKAFYECSHLIKIPSAPRQMAGSALQ